MSDTVRRFLVPDAQEPPRTAGIHFHWGIAPYERIHALQRHVVERRAAGTLPNILLTGEHEPVVTLGRRTSGRRAQGTKLGEAGRRVAGVAGVAGVAEIEVERGGEATYHGPGQLVAYPIIHLTQARRDLHRFQRDLEEVGIRTLSSFGIEAGRREGLTGVWVGEKKVQSVGVAVRRWVTWHGLALNVDVDLSRFLGFRPCGLDGTVMTSMAVLLGRPLSVEAVVPILRSHCDAVLPGGPFEASRQAEIEAITAHAAP